MKPDSAFSPKFTEAKAGFIAALLFSLVLLPVLLLLNLLIGPVNLFALGNRPLAHHIFLQTRLPQALTALLVGAALSVSGFFLQVRFHNPLADPSILGLSAGSSLAIALATLSSAALPFTASRTFSFFAAPVGALFVLLPLLLIAKRSKRSSFLLIFGLMISFFCNSLITLLMKFASAEQVKRYVHWTFGNFSSVPVSQLPFFAVSLIIPLFLMQFLLPGLQKLQLGSDYAQTMGLRIKPFQASLLLLSALIVGSVTFFCGPVSFLAIAAAQFSRSFLKSSNPYFLMPITALFGANLALLALFLSNLSPTGPIPINAILSLVGVPVVLTTLIREVSR